MKKKIILLSMITMLGLGSSMTVYASPQQMSDGNYFDAEYYAKHNPDVAALYGNDANALYQHYQRNGKAEGRQPYDPANPPAQVAAKGSERKTQTAQTSKAKKMADGGWFDAEYYAAHNPDVVALYGNDENALYQHYKLHGKAEGRQPYDPANPPV